MDLRDISWIRNRIKNGEETVCSHRDIAVEFRGIPSAKSEDTYYCLVCGKELPDYDPKWSSAFEIHIYDADTPEDISPVLNKLSEELDKLCETDPYMQVKAGAYALYLLTTEDSFKRVLGKRGYL